MVLRASAVQTKTEPLASLQKGHRPQQWTMALFV
ncbi:hypothetical protein Shel_22580 [Slackia heliotrinireducens DSM 20476]|uniref:Uncharacterized protein n=1 Tax=Slackia heliotrinireducens (strain ATCC 29202 / DSM 20476 / NCTC 11029 / RHS 1) TaxID=471855 RepID=C7N146_SLAHD|nr:hypothetical protein Shel_22580 [Slackia heliotrinireducens DSM 20476]